MHVIPAPGFDTPEERRSGQLDFSDLGTPLYDTTFVVVDLETTGTSSGTSEITEIGAVKTRGGEEIGEFSSLVRPRRSVITPMVQRLTGITNGMVAGAPDVSEVLPDFLEFARGSVLVAHNAGFDIGFLRAACEELDYPWPRHRVLDTVTLSRLVVGKDEVRNHKLSTLAAFFRTRVSPDHRALSDARATVDVLYGLFERFGSHGIDTLEQLTDLKPAGWRKRRAKTHLAKGVPDAPGVYMFLDGARRVLYVGTSRNMRRRVLNYFTAGETRGRLVEMITAAQEVSTIVTETDIEARVREVRLIGELSPPYNRRSKNPERRTWIRLSEDEFPRLVVTRKRPEAGSGVLGPFRSQATATRIKKHLERIYPLKSCTRRPGSPGFSPCPAGELGRCAGPCAGCRDPQEYRDELDGLVDLLAGRPGDLDPRVTGHMRRLASAQRYEEAAELRDDWTALGRAQSRAEKVEALRAVPWIQAWQYAEDGGLDLVDVRHGVLAGSARSASRRTLPETMHTLALTAAHVADPREEPTQADSASVTDEETLMLHEWLSSPGTILFAGGEEWKLPISGFSSRPAETTRP